MGDVQELSFQNVVDTILKPQGIKVGGYPDDLFIEITESDRDSWQCNICYLVARDAKQCDNKHNFCATCVFAWSMTYGANSDKCPVCRSKQNEYNSCVKLNEEINAKWIKCPELGCALRCPLRDFLQHSHGLKLYTQVDLTDIPQRRPAPVNPPGSHRVLLFPSLDRSSQSNPPEGQNLLQDMMLVLHLEMALRRRAIDRFSTEQNDMQRARHMTEVLAIQEQMQEITGFLNLLLSIPPGREDISERRNRFSSMNRFPAGAPHGGANDSSDESDSSESSNSSGVVSRMRLASMAQRNANAEERRRATLNQNRMTGRTREQPTSMVLGNSNTSGPNISHSGHSSATITPIPPQPNASQTAQFESSSLTGTQSSRRILTGANPPLLAARRESQAPPAQESTTPRLSAGGSGTVPNSIARDSITSRQVSATQPMLPPIPSAAISRPRTGGRPEAQAATRDQPETQPGLTLGTVLESPPPLESPPMRNPVPPASSNSTTISTTRARRTASQSISNSTAPRPGPRITRTRGRSESTASSSSSLPSTSGQLMRARRRSEIQRQIRENLETTMNESNPGSSNNNTD